LILSRRQGPPFSLALRLAAASRIREGSTLTCRGLGPASHRVAIARKIVSVTEGDVKTISDKADSLPIND